MTDQQLETILIDWRDNELPTDKAIEAIKRVMGRAPLEHYTIGYDVGHPTEPDSAVVAKQHADGKIEVVDVQHRHTEQVIEDEQKEDA